jgi:hypothetical protein
MATLEELVQDGWTYEPRTLADSGDNPIGTALEQLVADNWDYGYRTLTVTPSGAGYEIEETAGGTITLLLVSQSELWPVGDVLRYTFTDRDPYLSYQYRVRAVNPCGNGPWSETLTLGPLYSGDVCTGTMYTGGGCSGTSYRAG